MRKGLFFSVVGAMALLLIVVVVVCGGVLPEEEPAGQSAGSAFAYQGRSYLLVLSGIFPI